MSSSKVWLCQTSECCFLILKKLLTQDNNYSFVFLLSHAAETSSALVVFAEEFLRLSSLKGVSV